MVFLLFVLLRRRWILNVKCTARWRQRRQLLRIKGGTNQALA